MSLYLLLSFIFLSTFTKIDAQMYRYTLSWEDPQTHEYHIELTTEPQPGNHTLFQLPAWRPGRYYIQDFAAGISHFEAFDDNGKSLEWQKTAGHSWQVQNPAKGEATIRYRFYADVLDAGSSVLNTEQAYFNGVALFMHVAGRYDAPCILSVPSMPKDWKSATALRKQKGKYNVFEADSFHDLADSPTVLSPSLKTLHTKVGGADYYMHFQGNFPGNKATEKAVLSNIEQIIREQSAIFGGVPLREYHFIFQLVPWKSSHAVEHKYSSMYMRQDSAFASEQSVRSVNGVLAHEFFHLWNVKRIRPAAMWPYDYQREAYTGLQWFTEGVTDYYADLTLARSGLLAQSSYLGNLGRSISRLESSYGTSIVSPHASSFNSWLSRSNYKNPLHYTSYYSLGDRVGLLMDLELRRLTKGEKSLDDVFRYLYENYYQKGKGVPEEGVQIACEKISGQSFQTFFDRYVKGVHPIDYDAFLAPMGLKTERSFDKTAAWAHVGVQRMRNLQNGYAELAEVIPGSDASKAGLSNGDYILSVNDSPATEFDVSSFFADGKTGKKLIVNALQNGEIKEFRILFSGENKKYTYRVVKMDNPSAKQKAMLEDWLSAKAGS